MTVKSTVGWVFGIIAAVVISFIVYVGFENKNPTQKQPSTDHGPEYYILKKDYIDTPSKAQVDMRVLFPHKVTEKRIRGLLNNIYSAVKDRGFKYHDKPTHVFIDIYTSDQKFESEERIAWLQKLGSDDRPAITIDKRQLSLHKY